MRRGRTALHTGLVGGLVLISSSPVGATVPAAQQVLQIDGRGFGHGVGMAQVSAQAMALAGQDREQILNHFYPGTGRDVRHALVAVAVWEADAPTGSVTLGLPQGGQVTDGSRTVQVRPGAVLAVSVDGAGYHVRGSDGQAPPRAAALRAAFTSGSSSPSPLTPVLPTGQPSPSVAPPSPSASPSSSPSVTRSPQQSRMPTPSPRSTPTSSPTGAPLAFDSAGPLTVVPSAGGLTQIRDSGRSYRGQVRALARQGFRLINDVDLEDYLRGLGEVPKSWQPAALQTQAVAARTYALRATGQGRPLGYDLCADTRCQVYIGAGNEGASTSAAAAATRGEVVTYGGRLATTYYSANAGGRTASPGEGFGGDQTSPYLPSNVVAAGDVDAYQVTPTPEAVAARLGYGGQLRAITVVARGPSGRVSRLRLDGTAGSVELSGVTVARSLGLRSTLFSVRLTTGAAQALAAPDSAPTQLPPGLIAKELAEQAATAPPSVSATPTVALSVPQRPGRPVAPALVASFLALAVAVGVAVSVVRQGGAASLRPRR